MKYTSLSSCRLSKIRATENLQSSRSCYLCIFAARAMRFWCPRTVFKGLSVTAVFAAALAIGPSSAQAQFAASFDLSTLNGSNGFVINGVDAGDQSGFSVSGAGDVNGDGIDDLIIGANGADPNGIFSAGESYVVFGSNGGFSSTLDLSTLNGSNGFVINGVDFGDLTGVSVSGAGDVNGDGIDDLVVGGNRGDTISNLFPGDAYVVFGSNSGFSQSFDLSSLNGTNGFVLSGISFDDATGGSVSGAGDVNGDGFNDVIIGAGFADPNGNSGAGESYLVFGNNSGFPSSIDLSALNGSNGFVINGIDTGDLSGDSVSGAGDVNGDGIDDFIIGAPSADRNGNNFAGESYVVFGNDSGFPSSLELSTLNGSNGFVINGTGTVNESGISVSDAGDVNGDGIDDLIIGAQDIFGTGESYVVFGNNSGFSSSLDLSTLDGANGFVLNGIDILDRSGSTVSSAGDVNGDGIDDLIIRAFNESYVVFGNNSGFSSSLDLSTLDGTNGFVLNGVDIGFGTGGSVSGVGDVNGDGIDDVIIGASRADPNAVMDAGQSYVVFGQAAVTGPLIGDVNQDGTVDFFDIAPFISLLAAGEFLEEADINGDGLVDFFDISPFIDLLGSQ